MSKKFYLLVFNLMIGLSIFASPVDQNTAYQKAKSFLNQHNLNLTLNSSKALTIHRAPTAANTPYYIFNSTDGNGFVIMSGDDRTDAVIGYSDTGQIDPDNMPDGLAFMLRRYQEEMTLIDQLEPADVQQTAIHRVMSQARVPVAPLIKNFWGHMAPFNKFNPKVNDSTCVVGCAAVAMSELMGFYKYPENSLPVTGYTTPTRQLVLEDLPSVPFDWTNMRNMYKRQSYTSTEGNAVGWLMRYVGQALRSDFNTNTSSSDVSKIPTLLRQYGYHASDYWYSSWRTMNEWEDLLYQQVTKGQPVLISGFSTGKSGHMFLVDGYDEDDYFHIEWGWEGSSKGYFKLTLLSPYKNVSDNYNYMNNLGFIFNVYPEPDNAPETDEDETDDIDDEITDEIDETEVTDETDMMAANDSILLNSCLSLTSLTFTGIEVTTKLRNESVNEKLYEYGLGLYDSSYKMVKLLANETLQFPSNTKTITTTWPVGFGDMEDGTYRIYPISRLSQGDGIWHFDACKSANAYIQVEIADGIAKMKAIPAVEYNSFEFIDETPLYIGAVRRMKVNVTNNMMEKYNRFLYLFDNDQIRQIRLEHIKKNSSDDIEFLYYPRTIGPHTLTICTDTAHTKVLFSKEIEALDAVSYKLKFTYSIENYDKESESVIGNMMRVKVTVTNNGTEDYNDYIRILRKYVYWDQTTKYFANIPVGESQEFYFETLMDYGATYNLVGYYKSKSSSNNNTFSTVGFSINITAKRGIGYYTADGTAHFQATSKDPFTVPEDAVALDLTSLSTVPSDIVPNSNPNTFYYVTKSYASLADHNQIVNLAANKIVLTDGYSCFIPRDFTAAEISYTRTFEKGFMGVRNQNNWSTIVLPFDVQTITNTTNDQVVDWFKPGQNKDKNFWLRRFYGEEGYYAYFTNAETFKAGMPYIITVPGDYKGEEYSLVGKPLTFSAVDVTVKKGNTVADAQNFDFEGSLAETTTKGKYVYQLDEEMGGNNFVYISTSSTVKPFRAYFTSESEPLDGAALYVASYIDVFEDTDAISDVNISTPTNHGTLSVYSISGSKVKTHNNTSVSEALQSLPRGIYIINGKKYIK